MWQILFDTKYKIIEINSLDNDILTYNTALELKEGIVNLLKKLNKCLDIESMYKDLNN
jgi:hypothetical protein